MGLHNGIHFVGVARLLLGEPALLAVALCRGIREGVRGETSVFACFEWSNEC